MTMQRKKRVTCETICSVNFSPKIGAGGMKNKSALSELGNPVGTRIREMPYALASMPVADKNLHDTYTDADTILQIEIQLVSY